MTAALLLASKIDCDCITRCVFADDVAKPKLRCRENRSESENTTMITAETPVVEVPPVSVTEDAPGEDTLAELCRVNRVVSRLVPLTTSEKLRVISEAVIFRSNANSSGADTSRVWALENTVVAIPPFPE